MSIFLLLEINCISGVIQMVNLFGTKGRFSLIEFCFVCMSVLILIDLCFILNND